MNDAYIIKLSIWLKVKGNTSHKK